MRGSFPNRSFSLSVRQNRATSLIPASICLASFLHPSLSEISLCAFVVLELFQEQIVDGKDSYFQENQRMVWTITVQTWLYEAALFGELLEAAS